MASRLSAFAALNNSDSDSDSDLNPNLNSIPNSNSNNDLNSNQTKNIESENILSIDLGLGNGLLNYSSLNTQFIPILNTNFNLTENENIIYNNDNIIIGLQNNDLLVIKGQYNLSLLFGTLIIDSYILNDNSKSLIINASNLNSLPCLKSLNNSTKFNSKYFTNSFSCIIKLSNFNDNMQDLQNLYPHLKNLYSFDNTNINYTFSILTKPEQNKIAISLSESWIYHLNNLSSNLINNLNTLPLNLLIIGNKNTGKSTFLKLLANSLLSNNTLKKDNKKIIQILDIDPGQPEFCLPGCICLTKINYPLIGTIQSFNLSNDNNNNNIVNNSIIKYYGFTSPNIQPLNYFNQLNDLIDKINNSKNTITLINSPGWVKGFGTEIISNLNNSLNLNYLIQLSNDSKDLDLINDLNWDKNKTKILKLPSINSLNNYSPTVIRNFKLLSYIHYDFNLKNFNFNPLIFNSPYRISYASSEFKEIKKLNQFNGIIGISILDSQGLLISDLPQSIECQFMSLITIPKSSILKLENNFKFLNNYPNLIDENLIKSISSNWKFYGLCVIHSVDLVNKTINLYTPINLENLKNNIFSNNEKLILIKGKEELSIDEIYSNQILKNCTYWSNFGLSCLPYVSENINNEIAGSKSVSIRRNIQRR